MFFKLLPMYYLIAPAAAASTRIDAKDFVTRHAGEEAWDDLTEMLGPQPMLIEPAKYLDHIVNRHPCGSGVCLPIPRLNRLVMIVMGNSRAAVQH